MSTRMYSQVRSVVESVKSACIITWEPCLLDKDVAKVYCQLDVKGGKTFVDSKECASFVDVGVAYAVQWADTKMAQCTYVVGQKVYHDIELENYDGGRQKSENSTDDTTALRSDKFPWKVVYHDVMFKVRHFKEGEEAATVFKTLDKGLSAILLHNGNITNLQSVSDNWTQTLRSYVKNMWA